MIQQSSPFHDAPSVLSAPNCGQTSKQLTDPSAVSKVSVTHHRARETVPDSVTHHRQSVTRTQRHCCHGEAPLDPRRETRLAARWARSVADGPTSRVGLPGRSPCLPQRLPRFRSPPCPFPGPPYRWHPFLARPHNQESQFLLANPFLSNSLLALSPD